jgi:hypothetical protein
MLKNTAMRDAILSCPTTKAIIQAKAEADHKAYEAHLKRYQELKELLHGAFKTRRDVVYHALYRPETRGSSSRLWYLASTPELAAETKDMLQWSGTSEQNELKAKLLVNPPIFED